MSRSTGPILATGAITIVNSTILDDKEIEWNEAARIIVATGLAAGTLALMERPLPDLAVALGWATLVGMLFVKIDPKTPSPTERVLKWWDKAKG
jgi:hypothetical protein